MEDKRKHHRATQEQLQERINKVFALMRQGYAVSQICKVIVKEEQVSLRTAERAVEGAKKLLEELGGQSPAMVKGKLYARLDYLFSETTTGNAKNLDQALKVVDIEARLLPKQGGNLHHEPTQPSRTPESALSPELEQALKRITQHPATEGPEHG